jgi:DNA-binding NarL/FixJ family response regulator
MSIDVLIADNHPLVRDGLRFSIERSGKSIKIIAEASDGLEALQIAKRNSVDVFILDITMPRLNGLDVARELIRGHSEAKIIILSLHNSRAFVEEAMDVGARGYLTKEAASRNVVEAICEVHAGRFYLSPDISGYMINRALGRTKNNRATLKDALTGQERKVLQLIAEGRTSKEIASELGLQTNTIHAHRKNLMAKLRIHKETELVRFALREGIAKL